VTAHHVLAAVAVAACAWVAAVWADLSRAINDPTTWGSQ
jgi:hypothetical protein